MKTMTAAKAKTHFGEFLDSVQREPVIVTKNNRPVGIMFSMQDAEDKMWGERALAAQSEGLIGIAASETLMNDILNAAN